MSPEPTSTPGPIPFPRECAAPNHKAIGPVAEVVNHPKHEEFLQRLKPSETDQEEERPPLGSTPGRPLDDLARDLFQRMVCLRDLTPMEEAWAAYALKAAFDALNTIAHLRPAKVAP